MSQRTLVLAKPDAVRRGLLGTVISRIERKGWTVAELQLCTLSQEILAEHYAEHQGKPFYPTLLEFMTSGPVAVMIVEGERCIEGFRALAGATDPIKAAPGTIRGDHAVVTQENLVHGSDSEESAAREIKNFFPKGN